MRQELIDVEDRREAEALCPWAVRVIATTEGYRAFESYDDSEEWLLAQPGWGNWYAFAPMGSEAIYGYGTEEEAKEYADYRNDKRPDYSQFILFGLVEDVDKLRRLEGGNGEGFLLEEELEEIAALAVTG